MQELSTDQKKTKKPRAYRYIHNEVNAQIALAQAEYSYMNSNNVKGPTVSYKFYVCEFVGCANEEGKNDIDVLPKSWIKFDNLNNKLMVPYPDPPYTSKVCNKLQESVRLSHAPDKNWRMWEVALRGGANLYDKAESRLKGMRADAYAFTTDFEDQQSKADDETNAFRNENVEDILAQESNSNSSITPSVEDSASSSSNEEVSNVGKGKKATARKTYKPKKVVVERNKIKKTVKSQTNTVPPKPVISAPFVDLTKSALDDLDNLSGDELLNYTNKTLSNIEAVTSGYTARKDVQHDLSIFKFPPETIAVLKSLAGLKILVQKLQSDVTELKNKILGSDIQRLNETLQQNNLKLPLQTADDWKSFCDIIAKASLQDYISLYMKQQLDKIGNNPIKSCTNIFKKIFEKKLILQFTAFKKVNERNFVFKDSTCFKLLKMVILSNHRDAHGDFITEAVFNSSFSAAFNNSKDWGGR